jgi:probable HAF family extracellular repeat protein
MKSPRTIQAAKSILSFLAPVVLSLLCSSTTLLVAEASEARYRVIKIIEGSGTTVPEAGGINQKGQVVGSIDVRGSANLWLWSNGVREDLPLGNGKAGNAVALNNQGQVVGSFYTGESFIDFWGDLHAVYHAFVWDNGSLLDLGTLGGWNSVGLWINDQGVLVGASSTADRDSFPFITRDGQKHSLQSLISNATGWNLALETHYVAADGRIWGVGTYGTKNHIYEMTPETNGMYRIRSRGVIETIDVVKVFAINEFGQAVGRLTISAGRGSAFLWDEQGLILLDTPGPASFPYAVNNRGQVVGMTKFDSTSYNAFLWGNGVKFNLNDLVPPDSGVILTKAAAINDAGQIVCTYRNVASGFYGVCC